MGAQSFFEEHLCDTEKVSAEKAFWEVVQQAQWEHGHGGYTGTIAEKYEFVMIDVPEGVNPTEHAADLLSNLDPRINDKWGPAGCVTIPKKGYVFFGWASS